MASICNGKTFIRQTNISMFHFKCNLIAELNLNSIECLSHQQKWKFLQYCAIEQLKLIFLTTIRNEWINKNETENSIFKIGIFFDFQVSDKGTDKISPWTRFFSSSSSKPLQMWFPQVCSAEKWPQLYGPFQKGCESDIKHHLYLKYSRVFCWMVVQKTTFTQLFHFWRP